LCCVVLCCVVLCCVVLCCVVLSKSFRHKDVLVLRTVAGQIFCVVQLILHAVTLVL
jgi:hypothetical protein